MTILFDVSGQLRTLVWSNNLLIRMKRLTSRTTRYVTTTSILPRWVCGKDNCGRALSNESVAKTTVAERCPDESVANTIVLDSTDGEVRSMAQGEYKLFKQSAMQVRKNKQQSHQSHSKLFQSEGGSNLRSFAHELDALPSRRLSTCTLMRKQ